MSTPIEIAHGVVVPAGAIQMRAVRAGGPGGQNVNKVASKVELRVDLAAIVGLPFDARARLLAIAKGHLDSEGRLLITSQKTRDQLQNLEDAREKITVMIKRAMIRPVRRRATAPTRGSIERRITAKKQRAVTKQRRRSDDD